MNRDMTPASKVSGKGSKGKGAKIMFQAVSNIVLYIDRTRLVERMKD